MIIIVSAFISSVNQQKSISQYIDYGKYLLSTTDINNVKIIFIERKIYNEYFHKDSSTYIFKYELNEYEYTFQNNIFFVFFERQDNYLYKYNNEITNFNINTDNPSKDTLEYMFVICHKTEWLNMAIQLINNIKSEHIMLKLQECTHFLWIDFGIYHIFNNNTELFTTEINNLYKKHLTLHSKIRIGSCIYPTTTYHTTYHTDIYRNVAWYFAGGVFGGKDDILVKFAESMKQECINIIKERKHLMWEVNIWYLLYLKNPNMFDLYLCNHNSTIIENY